MSGMNLVLQAMNARDKAEQEWFSEVGRQVIDPIIDQLMRWNAAQEAKILEESARHGSAFYKISPEGKIEVVDAADVFVAGSEAP
jgi:hypothetical protein